MHSKSVKFSFKYYNHNTEVYDLNLIHKKIDRSYCPNLHGKNLQGVNPPPPAQCILFVQLVDAESLLLSRHLDSVPRRSQRTIV